MLCNNGFKILEVKVPKVHHNDQQTELPFYPRWIVRYTVEQWGRSILGSMTVSKTLYHEDECHAPSAQEAADIIKQRHKKAHVLSAYTPTDDIDCAVR